MKVVGLFFGCVLSFAAMCQNSYYYRIKSVPAQSVSTEKKTNTLDLLKDYFANVSNFSDNGTGTVTFSSTSLIVPFSFASAVETKGLKVETIEKQSSPNWPLQGASTDSTYAFFYYKPAIKRDPSRKP